MTLNCLNRAGIVGEIFSCRPREHGRRACRSISPMPLESPSSPWAFSFRPLAVKRDAAASGTYSYAAPPAIARHRAHARRRAASGRRGLVDFSPATASPLSGAMAPANRRSFALRRERRRRTAGPASCSPRRALPICRRSRTYPAFATTLDYVLAGLGELDDPYSARAMMAELGLDPAADPARLSGGEARQAALVRALSPEPDILLLDEPTNHLDLVAIEWLESRLAQSRSAVALISHDKRLLKDLTRATIWLDRGRTRRLDQGFGAFEAWRDAKLEEEELERHKLDRQIANEEHWMRYGVTARRKRNMRRVAELADLRRERREARGSVGLVSLTSQEAKASGALVIEAERISKAYDGSADRARFLDPRHARRPGSGSSAPTARARPRLSTS